MANFTYLLTWLPFSDTEVYIYEHDTTTVPTFYDETDVPGASPAFNGSQVSFRVPEGPYDIVMSHASDTTKRATTTIQVPTLERRLNDAFIVTDHGDGSIGGFLGS